MKAEVIHSLSINFSIVTRLLKRIHQTLASSYTEQEAKEELGSSIINSLLGLAPLFLALGNRHKLFNMSGKCLWLIKWHEGACMGKVNQARVWKRLLQT